MNTLLNIEDTEKEEIFDMPYELNENIKRLKPYDPIEGDFAVRLDANESFLTLPPELFARALEAAAKTPLNRYPDHRASGLCEAFAGFYRVPFECVMAGNGSDELISLLVGAFFTGEDELITLAGDFSMYRLYGDVFNVKTSIFPKRVDLTIDVDGLIYYAKLSHARGIIFSNPCNPTSLCLEKNEVLRIVSSLPDCLLIIDEAYMDFADASVLREVERYDNLIVLKTCSKAVGLAALRLGFAVSNKKLIDALLSVKSPYNVNALSQAVGREVLLEHDYLNICTEKLIFARDSLYSGVIRLYAAFHTIEMVYQTATNFVFIKAARAREIYEALCLRSIAVRQMENYLRICAGDKEENAAVLAALHDILKGMEGE